MNGAVLVRYDAAKVAFDTAHRCDVVKGIRGKSVAMRPSVKRAKGTTEFVQALSFQGSKFVSVPAASDIAAGYSAIATAQDTAPTVNSIGATGHHARRADHFVRQRQRHHHRGINNHGLYAPAQP
jgi:hypothetical protein